MARRTPQWRNRVGQVEMRLVDTLIPHPANYRNHPRNQQALVEGSLEEFGWVMPIIVSEASGYTLNGHLRGGLAQNNEQEMAPVLPINGLTPDEELAIIALLDPSSGLASHDEEKYSQLLELVHADNQMVSSFFDQMSAARRNRNGKVGAVKASDIVKSLDAMPLPEESEEDEEDDLGQEEDEEETTFELVMTVSQARIVHNTIERAIERHDLSSPADALVTICERYTWATRRPVRGQG